MGLRVIFICLILVCFIGGGHSYLAEAESEKMQITMEEIKEFFDNKVELLENAHRAEMIKLHEYYMSEIVKIDQKYQEKMTLVEKVIRSEIGVLQDDLTACKIVLNQGTGEAKSNHEKVNSKLQTINSLKAEGQTLMIRTEVKARKQFLKEANKSGDQESLRPENNLKEPIGRMNSKTNELVGRIESSINKRRQVETSTRVAFFASLTNSSQHQGANQDIVFDNAVTNIGNAYHPHHGIFTTPVDGVYVFLITLVRSGSQTWAHVMVNRQIIAKLGFEYNHMQTSQTVIVELAKGDDVSVQNTYLDRGFGGDYYSTFSGFLLYENVNVIPVVGK